MRTKNTHSKRVISALVVLSMLVSLMSGLSFSTVSQMLLNRSKSFSKRLKSSTLSKKKKNLVGVNSDLVRGPIKKWAWLFILPTQQQYPSSSPEVPSRLTAT